MKSDKRLSALFQFGKS